MTRTGDGKDIVYGRLIQPDCCDGWRRICLNTGTLDSQVKRDIIQIVFEEKTRMKPHSPDIIYEDDYL